MSDRELLRRKAILFIRSGVLLAIAIPLSAQTPAPEFETTTEKATVSYGTLQNKPAASRDPSAYRLGPGDQFSVWLRDAEEITSRPYRANAKGEIRLPLVGWLEVGGMTIQEAELTLAERLKPYFLNPDVTITMTEFREQPISVLGSVRNPGIQQIAGKTTLAEAISRAGGFTEDTGYIVQLSRRVEFGEIPLESAHKNSDGTLSSADILVEGLLNGENPAGATILLPHDIISVPRANLVYVIGEVNRSGGFALELRQTVSVLQVLAMAEGLKETASPKNAKILRPSPGEERIETAVNLKAIMTGEQKDVELASGDILVVPGRGSASRALRVALATGVTIGSGMAIWRLGR